MTDQMLQAFTDRFDRLEAMTLIASKNVLDLEEAALYIKQSKGQLYRLTSAKQIPFYKKNRKVYFKKTELDEWMLANPVMTETEINRQADRYIATRKR